MEQFHEIVPEFIINCSGACFTAKVEVEQFHEIVPELFRNCSGVFSLLFYSKKWMWNNFTKLFLNCSGIVPVRFSPVLQQKWRWGMFIFVPDLFRDPPCQAFCGGFRPSVYALNGLFNTEIAASSNPCISTVSREHLTENRKNSYKRPRVFFAELLKSRGRPEEGRKLDSLHFYGVP